MAREIADQHHQIRAMQVPQRNDAGVHPKRTKMISNNVTVRLVVELGKASMKAVGYSQTGRTHVDYITMTEAGGEKGHEGGM